ncbi:MAG: fibronectin type III domain-containing protein [Eubacterium sp.]|nr:fibronectin type III domain-containing protein [Eubacterium sp.]
MKRKKCIKTIAVVFILLIGICFGDMHMTQAGVIDHAMPYTIGTSANGVLAEGGDEKLYYMFNLSASGVIELSGSAYMGAVRFYIYDENAKELWSKDYYWNSTSEVISFDEKKHLTSGTYYFCVSRYGNNYGNYKFNIGFESSNETFAEINGGSNNSINTASVVNTMGTQYSAQLALNDEKDFYKIDLANSGKIRFNATFFDIECVRWKIYGQNGEELLSRDPWWNSTTRNIAVDEDIYLTSGTYYLAISTYGNKFGRYTFSLPFTSSNETFPEILGGSNNSIETASQLTLDKEYVGELAINDDKDFYCFNLASDQTTTITADLQMECAYIKLYDGQGNEIWSESPWWNSVTQTISFSRITTLNKGTYYLAVVRYGSKCGNYTLKIARLTKENCPHSEYDKQWVSSTYFSKGYTKYTCKACGYIYKNDYQPVKKLSQVYLYNYYNAGKGSLKLYWDSQSDATGYQIRYCRGKNFKSGVITKTIKGSSKNNYTIKKLSRNKTYYVQVRSYKKSGSKTVYGKWSAKKAMKTK